MPKFSSDRYGKGIRTRPLRKSLAPAGSSPLTEDREALAAVKLDLDNLGLFFRDVTKFDKRDKISRTLNDTILQCIEEDRWLHLIFVGGDDIFSSAKQMNQSVEKVFEI